MNTDVQIFDYRDKHIRTIQLPDGIWWVLKDVCLALEISKYRDIGRTLDQDERASLEMDTLGGLQKMTFINEAGLYKVIFRSNKPEANNFKRWVTHEVLPSIRKTGSYGAQPQLDMTFITEIITKTAAAVAAEIAKQLIPIFRAQAEPVKTSGIDGMFEEDLLFLSKCKLERAPDYIREPVDEMFRHMMHIQRLNFSAIVRFCCEKGFYISNPAVRRYYDRVICALED